MNRSNATNPGLHRALAGLLLAVSVGAVAQGTNCGALTNGNGPWDYRKERASIKLVEDFHFTPNVEALIGGATGPIGGDLDYTLRASPNHHKALIAVSRLSARLKTDQIPSMKYTVDCWFDRALRFKPDDTVVRGLFALHLGRTGREAAAVAQLDEAVRLGAENAFTQYSVGMVFLELKLFDRALQQAHRAEAMGLERTELQEALRAAGKWEDRSVSPPAPTASSRQP